MNECATSNGGCSQICTNLVGGFSCGCYTGYQQVGTSCAVPGMSQLLVDVQFYSMIVNSDMFPVWV